jgi:UDP-glucose 4-epimerase
MKILVTGGCGFIGSHVVDVYLKAGHKVVAADNLSTGLRKNLNPRAKFYKLDIEKHHQLERIFRKERFEVVNHHAAQAEVRRSIEDPILDAHVNIIGGLNLLHCCHRFGIKRFIYANTGGALYGEVPARNLPVKEDFLIRPESPYGLSKYTFENYLELYFKLFELRFVSLRYANIYGPRQSPDGEAGVVQIFGGKMLRNQPPTIFGDGKQTRDYVYVKDAARANLLALKKGDNCKINIGTGVETSVLKIFELIAREVGYQGKPKHGPAVKGELRRASQDPSLAQKVLGWQPRVDIEKGIRQTIKYIQDND